MNERAPRPEQPLPTPEMNPSKEEQPQYKISSASVEDVEQLKSMFRDNEEAQESYDESFSQQENGEGAFYIAKDEKGAIAGYATILYEHESTQVEGINGAMIEDVRVFPDHQRQGLGSKIIQACEKQVQDRGQDRVVLSVRHDNEAAITMYSKNGYHEIPNSRFEPSDPNLPGSLEVQGFYMEKKLSSE